LVRNSLKSEAKARSKASGFSAKEISQWYMQHSPDSDQLSIRAHVLLRRAYLQIEARNEVGKESDYTSGRFNVLSLLYRAGKQGLLMTEIAAGINISITNLPKLMDDLAARKLIVRVRDEEDGRKRWARLTPQGRKLMQQEIPRAATSITKAWESFGKGDKRQLIDMLEKLLAGLPERSNGHQL
jgi:MarR family transcriptional regulator, 2-MHQ and catechol-resistance regulon repressor